MGDMVTDRDILAVISKATGIPMQQFMVGEREKLLEMEKALTTRVVGQPEACVALFLCFLYLFFF